MRRARAVGVVAVIVILVIGGLFVWVYVDPFDPPSYAPDPQLAPIQHIFVIMQENHPYDNYFGAYCPQTGPYCSSAALGTPAGTCVPYSINNPTLGCASPFPLGPNQRPSGDLPHNLSAAKRSYDNGRMDGFIQAYGGNKTPVGYYTAASVSAYWDMAEEYGLGDYFFSPALGASIANHWILLAGTSPAMGYPYVLPDFVKSGRLTTQGIEYLNEANNTPTMADELSSAGISWRFYDYPIPVGGYDSFLTRASTAVNDPTMTQFDEFNPIVSKASTFTAPYATHFVSRYQITNDLASGNVSSVSWIFPTFPQSEHPPSPLYVGETWTTNVIDSIESSRVWSSSVIFLLWDEYGGWYDHVAPPNEAAHGPGFRVPLLVIGPYVKENFINSQFASSPSILKFIEQRFGLPPLGPADGSATSLIPYFDFGQAPRAPLNFVVNETYPAPLQTVLRASASPLTGPEPSMFSPAPAGAASVAPSVVLLGGSGSTLWARPTGELDVAAAQARPSRSHSDILSAERIRRGVALQLLPAARARVRR
jgi:phospholipase C